jgi:DNA adenine methylase
VHRESRSAVRHPAFPWFGGKWRLADWIISKLPEHRIYVEPFGGAGSVLLRKPPSEVEVYNDLDRDVANFFRVCRTQFHELVRLCALSPWHRGEWYDARSKLAESRRLPALDRAHLFAVVAIQSFAGSFGASWGFARTASSRNMAETCSRWLNVPTTIYAVADRLQRVQMDCDKASVVIRRYDHADGLLYCDPPYHPETRKSGEYRHELSLEEHAELLDQLNACKARVVLSGYRCPLYDRALRRWKRHTRRVACMAERRLAGDSRTYRTETLWIKPSR